MEPGGPPWTTLPAGAALGVREPPEDRGKAYSSAAAPISADPIARATDGLT